MHCDVRSGFGLDNDLQRVVQLYDSYSTSDFDRILSSGGRHDDVIALAVLPGLRAVERTISDNGYHRAVRRGMAGNTCHGYRPGLGFLRLQSRILREAQDNEQ